MEQVDTDGETKVGIGSGEVVNFPLHHLTFRGDIECTIICEKEVPYCIFFHLCLGLQPTGVEEFAASPVSDLHFSFVIIGECI